MLSSTSLPLTLIRLAGGVTVEGEQVRGAARDSAECARGRQVADAAAQSLGSREALEAGKVGSQTGNVG